MQLNSKEIHHGVNSSRVNRFRVVPGKVRYLCSIISSESSRNSNKGWVEKAYGSSCVIVSLLLSLACPRPQSKVQLWFGSLLCMRIKNSSNIYIFICLFSSCWNELMVVNWRWRMVWPKPASQTNCATYGSYQYFCTDLILVYRGMSWVEYVWG